MIELKAVASKNPNAISCLDLGEVLLVITVLNLERTGYWRFNILKPSLKLTELNELLVGKERG